MQLIDNRDQSFRKGDMVVMDTGKKYWVVYENSCIAWHFVDVETFEFHNEKYLEISTHCQVGATIEGLGKVVEVIKKEDISVTLEDPIRR